MKIKIAALDDPLPSLGDLLGRWFGFGISRFKSLFIILTTLLAVFFLVICLFYSIVICLYMMYNQAPGQIDDS